MAKWSALGRHTNGRWYCRCGPKFKYFGLISKVTEQEATKLYEAWIASEAIRDSSPQENSTSATVGGLLGFFLAEAKGDRQSKNWKDKERYLKEFSQAFGHKIYKELKPYMIEKWVDEHKAWNQTTRCNCYKHLTSAGNWLEKNDRIESNVFKKCDRPQAKVRSDSCLITDEEYARLLPQCKQPYRDIVVLLWETGCRPDEVLSARVDMYVAREKELVLPKHKTDEGGKERTIYLTGEADEIIRERIDKVKSGLLFRSVNKNKIDPTVFLQYLKRACKRAGLKDSIIAYSFRHSFGYRKIKEGYTLEDVSSYLGNSVPICEKHYAHLRKAMRVRREEQRRNNSKES